MKVEFSLQIFEKYSNIKVHKHSSSGSGIVPCGWTEGRTDLTKLVVAFRNFVNAPKYKEINPLQKNSALIECRQV
jgi:hypothetical protein